MPASKQRCGLRKMGMGVKIKMGMRTTTTMGCKKQPRLRYWAAERPSPTIKSVDGHQHHSALLIVVVGLPPVSGQNFSADPRGFAENFAEKLLSKTF